MNKSLFKNPLVILIIATVSALIPLLFENDTILVLLRLLSFGLFFYAVHLFFGQRKRVSK